jgi:hypothetical protein
LGEFPLFLVGTRGHRDDVADRTEKTDFDGKRIVAGEVIEVKIEKQNIRGIFHGKMQRIFQVCGNTNDVSGAFALKQVRDEFANGSTIVGNQNTNRRFWDGTHDRSPQLDLSRRWAARM